MQYRQMRSCASLDVEHHFSGSVDDLIASADIIPTTQMRRDQGLGSA